MPRGSHDGVVVVKAYHAQHKVFGQRMVGADEGLRAAGAFKTVQPHNGRSGLRLHGLGNVLGACAA